MNESSSGEVAARARGLDIIATLARWLIGALFIYMGLHKALHPVEFLKLVRQYDLPFHYLLLNFIAATLPWFEIFCGLLLVCGVAVRGAALVLAGLLVPFTVAILLRALAMQKTGGLPFCAIKFDCGCGAGEVIICHKLMENILLTFALFGLAMSNGGKFCLRPCLWKNPAADALN